MHLPCLDEKDVLQAGGRLIEHRAVSLGHHDPGRLQAPHRISGDRRQRRVESRVGELARQHPDPIPGSGLGGDVIRFPGHRGHHGRRGSDRVGQQPEVVERGRQRGDAGQIQHAVAGLEADDTAVRRGDTNGPSGIGAQRGRAYPGAHQRRRPAAGPAGGAGGAGGAGRVPGLRQIRVRRPGGVLQQRGQREHVCPRCPQRRDHRCVSGCRRAGHVDRVAVPPRASGDIDDVLHRDGHPVEWAVGCPRRGGQGRDHRVEWNTQPVEPLVGGQQVQVGYLAYPLAPLDGPDQRAHVMRQRACQHVDLLGHLGRAVPDGQVSVDAAVRFGAAAVERHQALQRALEIIRLEPVEADRTDRRLRQHFSRDGQHERAIFRSLQGVGDRQVGHRAGEEHGAVGLLGPQITQDGVGGLRVGQRLRDQGQPFGGPTVEFADAKGADVSLDDQPGREVVGSEVHEADHQVLLPHGIAQDVVGESVLQRDDGRAGVQPAAQLGRRRGRVVGLHRDQHDAGEPFGQILGGDGRRVHGEILDRTGDVQPAVVDRCDMIAVGITEQHVVPGAPQVCAHGPTDGTGADDGELHGIPRLSGRRPVR